MEEDLKVLEKYVEKDIPCNSCKYCAERPKVAGALRNLINRNKEVEEKANKLGKLYYEVNENCIKYEKDYIPKSKVREVIEDINNNKPIIAELKLRKLVEERND